MTSTTLPRVLRTVAAYSLPGDLRSRLTFPTEPFDDATWTELLDQLVVQRLVGLAKMAVEDGALAATASQRAALEQTNRFLGLRILWLEGVLLETVKALAEEQIPVRVLKGAALAHLVYPDPSLRPYGDVDVLVPTETFDRAIAVLQKGGATRVHGEPRVGFVAHFGKSVELIGSGTESIDLHRSLAPGPYAVMITSDSLFAHVLQVPLHGRTVPALDPVGRFLHACFHATVGNPSGALMPVRDVAQTLLAPDLDTEAALALARLWRAEAVVARALLATWDLLAIYGEGPLSAWSRRYRATDRELAVIRTSTAGDDEGRGFREVAEMVRAIPGLNNKLTYLGALALPGDEYLAERHQTPRSRLAKAFLRARARQRP